MKLYLYGAIALLLVAALSSAALYIRGAERAKADLERCRAGVSLLEDHAHELSRAGRELGRQCEADAADRAALWGRLSAAQRRWAARPAPTPCPAPQGPPDGEPRSVCPDTGRLLRERLARISAGAAGDGDDPGDPAAVP